MVAEGESEQMNVLSGECDGYDQMELDELLDSFSDVFSSSPGNTQVVTLHIVTGDCQPIRQAPYSVPIGIRDKVRKELKDLEELHYRKVRQSMGFATGPSKEA